MAAFQVIPELLQPTITKDNFGHVFVFQHLPVLHSEVQCFQNFGHHQQRECRQVKRHHWALLSLTAPLSPVAAANFIFEYLNAAGDDSMDGLPRRVAQLPGTAKNVRAPAYLQHCLLIRFKKPKLLPQQFNVLLQILSFAFGRLLLTLEPLLMTFAFQGNVFLSKFTAYIKKGALPLRPWRT